MAQPTPTPSAQPGPERVRGVVHPLDQVECLAQIIPLGERHLRTAVMEYTQHCHLERNHQGLENQLIENPSGEVNVNGGVECRPRLGRILNYYARHVA